MDIGPESEALVEYDYEAQHTDELTIRVGDLVTELAPTEPGWMRGKLRGKVGVFPDNFVKMVHRDMAKLRPKPTDPPATGSLKSNGVMRRAADSASTRPGRRRCKALFSYTPEKDDELGLKLHDIIDVLEEVEPGWWKGSLNGKVGVFPSNFVEELPPLADADAVQEIKPKPVKGVGLGDILRDSKSRPPPPQLPRPPDPTPAPQLPPKPVKELCRALFAYQRQNDDELTLKEGDIVTIVSKESEDKGWWRGELAGKVGVFPDNFVEIISSAEKPARPGKPPSKPSVKPETPQASGRPASIGQDNGKTAVTQNPPAAEAAPPSAGPATVTDGAKKPPKPDGDTSLEEFDAVERCSERLTHITADRARAPGRRPTSTIFSRESMSPQPPASPSTPSEATLPEEPELVNGAVERENTSSASPTTPAPPPWMKELQRAQNKRISRLVETDDDKMERQTSEPAAPSEPAPSAQPPWMRELQRAHSKRLPAAKTKDDEKASGDTRPAAADQADSAAAAPAATPAAVPAAAPAATPAPVPTPAPAPTPASAPARPARPELPADVKARKPVGGRPVKPADAAAPAPSAAAAAAPARPAPPTSAPAAGAASPSDSHQLQEQISLLQKQLTEQSRQFTDALTALRADYTKRMRTVLDELDAEKKARLVMQVQLDRLDKLVKDMNFSV